MLRHASVVEGKTYVWWEYDPAFRPKLPRGAIAGDVAQQVYCNACHVPKYFYVDEPRRCIQCAEQFTFDAREQKYWYETRKFNFCSVPVRCAACRRRRRSEHALREQIGRARREVEANPEDGGAHLALARAIVECFERTEAGRLDEAVAAARRAARHWPDAREAELWEGIAHLRAGRGSRGRECLQRFLTRRGSVGAGLEAKGRRYLEGREV